MAYTILNGQLGMQKIADTVLTAATTMPKPWKHGDIVRAVDPDYGVGEFIYLKGVGSTVIGSAVIYYPDSWTTALASTSTTGFVAVAMSANVASQSGWYQIGGKGVIKAGTVADDAKVWATATPGTVDDATADGYLIHNAWFGSADGTPSAGLAEVELARPYIDGITTND